MNRDYSPDKWTPEAIAQKAESARFIEALRRKQGVPEHVLYPPREESQDDGRDVRMEQLRRRLGDDEFEYLRMEAKREEQE